MQDIWIYSQGCARQEIEGTVETFLIFRRNKNICFIFILPTCHFSMPTNVSVDNLDEILHRSDVLEEAIIDLLDLETYQTFDASDRVTVSLSACIVSMDHARGLRALIRENLPTPAISLMRLQYEALTRSVWLLYAAPDSDVEKLNATLTSTAESAAKRLPMLSEMLIAIEGKAPPSATQMLTQFKDISAGALNSFVHGGIHPLKRQSDGYPLSLLSQVIRNSNGFFTMSGMIFAILSGNHIIAKRMAAIQPDFNDCLPELLPSTSN